MLILGRKACTQLSVCQLYAAQSSRACYMPKYIVKRA